MKGQEELKHQQIHVRKCHNSINQYNKKKVYKNQENLLNQIHMEYLVAFQILTKN
jgi:hypothetical protein